MVTPCGDVPVRRCDKVAIDVTMFRCGERTAAPDPERILGVPQHRTSESEAGVSLGPSDTTPLPPPDHTNRKIVGTDGRTNGGAGL